MTLEADVYPTKPSVRRCSAQSRGIGLRKISKVSTAVCPALEEASIISGARNPMRTVRTTYRTFTSALRTSSATVPTSPNSN